MTGPFYVRDKDFIDNQVFVLADFCKDCAFCSESDSFCCMNPCIYFEHHMIDENKEGSNE